MTIGIGNAHFQKWGDDIMDCFPLFHLEQIASPRAIEKTPSEKAMEERAVKLLKRYRRLCKEADGLCTVYFQFLMSEKERLEARK